MHYEGYFIAHVPQKGDHVIVQGFDVFIDSPFIQQADIQVKADKGQVIRLPEAVSLNEVVRALNAVGATPQDLLAILQAMKAAGALHAELEVI